MFGSCKGCAGQEKLIQTLLVEKADTQELILKLLAENKELVDKVIALSRPESIRELRRESTKQPSSPASEPPKLRFPGLNPHRRPPITHLQLHTAPEGEPAAEDIVEKAVAKLNG